MSPSRPHRCDEFPAEYSSASCSPAELTSASSASVMLQPTTSVRQPKAANGEWGLFLLSQLRGAPQGIGGDGGVVREFMVRTGRMPDRLNREHS